MADDALRLADMLQAEIDSGRCLRYALSRGTVGNVGTTGAEANALLGAVVGALNHMTDDKSAKLQICEDTDFPFSVEHVQEFAIFLRHCGGFQIC